MFRPDGAAVLGLQAEIGDGAEQFEAGMGEALDGAAGGFIDRGAQIAGEHFLHGGSAPRP